MKTSTGRPASIPRSSAVPAGAGPKVVDRLRKNYALDRARYFIPFATETNVALVMTARVWATTIRTLDALPFPEARECARQLRARAGEIHPAADEAQLCRRGER